MGYGMPVERTWYDDQQQIVIYRFIGKWTYEELEAVLIEAQPLVEALPHRVASIWDARRSSLLPPGSFFFRFRDLMQYRPPNIVQVTIVVGANGLVRSLGNAFNRIYGRSEAVQTIFFDTLEDGIAKAEALLDGSP